MTKKVHGNFGKRRTDEARAKMSDRAKLRRLSEAHKKKISEKLKGRIFSEEHRKNLSLKMKGRTHSETARQKNKEAHLGSRNARWIKDRTKLKRGRGKTNSATIEWRKEVYERDRWICQLKNEECKGRIEAHHIFNWVDFPTLRYVISNGITLCHFHHPLKWSEEERMIPIFQDIIKNHEKTS